MLRLIVMLCGAAALAGPAFALAMPAAHAPSALDPLVARVIERLHIGDEVARAKWDSGKTVSDPAREAALLESVRAQAAGAGIPAEWAQRFFRDQIEASKLVQTVLLNRWQRAGNAPALPASGDLSTSLRPRLDRLTAALVHDLRQSADLSQQPGCHRQLERTASRHAAAAHLDALHRAALREALRHVCAAPASPASAARLL